LLRRNLRRQDVAAFFAKLAPTDIAIEACGASHHWGRTLQAIGHRVRLIPAQYVKPFVKRGKNLDSTVRVEARRLRRKPAEYYSSDPEAARTSSMLTGVDFG
jgi:transposase